MARSRLTQPKSWPPIAIAMLLCALFAMSGCSKGAASGDGEERAEGAVQSQSPDDHLAIIKFRSSKLYPEGFAWDAKRNRFLVGSMGHAKLVTVTMDGAVEEFASFYEEANRDAAFLETAVVGVTVDAARNRVLAAVHGIKDPTLNALVAWDLDSKERILHVNLESFPRELSGGVEDNSNGGRAQSHEIANDATVDLDGNVYLTNSGGNWIWKVAAGESTAVRFATVPQFPILAEVEETKKAGSNGILYIDGYPGAYLLVGQSNSGALFRVALDEDLDGEAKVWEVKLKDGKVMVGNDGFASLPDGSVVVVSYDTAWLLTSSDSWRTATVVDQVPLNFTEFTTNVAAVGHRVFTIQLHVFDLVKGVEREEFTIKEVEFSYEAGNNPVWLLVIFVAFVVVVVAWKFRVSQFDKEYNKKRL